MVSTCKYPLSTNAHIPRSATNEASSLKLEKLHSEDAIEAMPPRKLKALLTFVVYYGCSCWLLRWPTSKMCTVPVLEHTVRYFVSTSKRRSKISAGFVPRLNSATASPVLAFQIRTSVPCKSQSVLSYSDRCGGNESALYVYARAA